jgi:hypothetical protein
MFLQKLFRSAANVPAAFIEPTRTEQQLPAREFLERVTLALREAAPNLDVKAQNSRLTYFDQFSLFEHSQQVPMLRLTRQHPDKYVADNIMDFLHPRVQRGCGGSAIVEVCQGSQTRRRFSGTRS